MFFFQAVLQQQLNFSFNVSLQVEAFYLVFDVKSFSINSVFYSSIILRPLYPTKDRRQAGASPS